MQKKKGILLLNLGTPDSPATKDVRKYLREFLMDGRVIDIPFLFRFLLVNGIIAPFRAPKSAHEYQKVWTQKGSPLKVYGLEIESKLQSRLGDDYLVVLGMRYQSPSIESALKKLKEKNVGEIMVLPLYPQYASATTGSTLEEVMRVISKWQIIPDLRWVSNFPDYKPFVKAFAEKGLKEMEKMKYDHFVFSYHGLPERQIRKGSVNNHCKLGDCCSTYNKNNSHCYRAQCFHTTREIAKEMNIGENYTVCFQSRLGKDPWIKPYTEEMIEEFVKKGYENLLVFSPSFVADCLETTVEIGETYKEQFIEKGGKNWTLVDSLNDDEAWVECLASMTS